LSKKKKVQPIFLRCEKISVGLDFFNTPFIVSTSNDNKAVTYLVLNGNKLIGAFTYILLDKTLFSRGTFITRGHRRKGLAEKLWCKAIKKDKPSTIKVETITKSGCILIESLRRQFPTIEWAISKNK
jgi:predicted GNAT family acetyltransferase